jgi:hypothetical protein
MSNVEGPGRKMATKSRENTQETAKPDVRQESASRKRGSRHARLPMFFCDFSRQVLVYPPSRLDIPSSAFFCSGAEGDS